MGYIKHIIIITIVLLNCSCSSGLLLSDEVFVLNQPHRIIPHNFEFKYELIPNSAPESAPLTDEVKSES